MDTDCKSGNRTRKQHLHLMHIPQPELVISCLEWCWKAFPIEGPKMEQATRVLSCYLNQVETGIRKLSDYKLNKKLLRHEMRQKLFTLINNCTCMVWDMAAGSSPEVCQAEVLQVSCAYLEY